MEELAIQKVVNTLSTVLAPNLLKIWNGGKTGEGEHRVCSEHIMYSINPFPTIVFIQQDIDNISEKDYNSDLHLHIQNLDIGLYFNVLFDIMN